jgi:hypothetical protein
MQTVMQSLCVKVKSKVSMDKRDVQVRIVNLK